MKKRVIILLLPIAFLLSSCSKNSGLTVDNIQKNKADVVTISGQVPKNEKYIAVAYKNMIIDSTKVKNQHYVYKTGADTKKMKLTLIAVSTKPYDGDNIYQYYIKYKKTAILPAATRRYYDDHLVSESVYKKIMDYQHKSEAFYHAIKKYRDYEISYKEASKVFKAWIKDGNSSMIKGFHSDKLAASLYYQAIYSEQAQKITSNKAIIKSMQDNSKLVNYLISLI